MAKPIVKKVPPEKMHLWPSVKLVPLCECPEYDDYGAWVFLFEATYGKDAGPRLNGKKQFLQWCIRGRTRHQGDYARAEFLKRAERQGIRFIYLFECQRPPLAETVRLIKEYNAKLLAERAAALPSEAA